MAGERAWPDVGMATALGAYFAYQLVAAYRYPPEPAFFPRMVAVAGLLLAAVIAVRALAPAAGGGAGKLDLRKVALSVAAPVAYGLGLWLLGYWAASVVALILFPLLLGFRRTIPLVATSIGVTLIFGVVLSHLEIRLPQGLLFR